MGEILQALWKLLTIRISNENLDRLSTIQLFRGVAIKKVKLITFGAAGLPPDTLNFSCSIPRLKCCQADIAPAPQTFAVLFLK